MRNPLTVATLYNNFLLKRNNLASRDQNYATLVQDSLRNLAGFLDEILTVAKMEHGQLKLVISSYNLNQLITEVAQNHGEIAQMNGFQLELDLPSQPQSISIDATLFKRVLDNLLSNAFKYAPEGSRVTVRLRYSEAADGIPHQADSFCIQVIDQGPGIAPENYERIFKKFEVVALKQAGQEQVGLGLPFCRMVVEAHNGRISVSQNQPNGAIFTVQI
jgi:signal transduction histidine kinase